MNTAQELFTVGMRVQMNERAHDTFGTQQLKNGVGVVVGFKSEQVIRVQRPNIKRVSTTSISGRCSTNSTRRQVPNRNNSNATLK